MRTKSMITMALIMVICLFCSPAYATTTLDELTNGSSVTIEDNEADSYEYKENDDGRNYIDDLSDLVDYSGYQQHVADISSM